MMKKSTIAALVAAQISVVACPAQAADQPREDLATQQHGRFEGSSLGNGQASESPRAAEAREDKPKKGKSTGDKVLTGAAVVLGIGALAVGGLLVALFVS